MDDIAVRLANEGVPIRAIARAVLLPSAAVRERLEMARAEGYLIDLPCEDWPPGSARDPRVSPPRLPDKAAIQAAFGLSGPQAAVLQFLLLRSELPRRVCQEISNYTNVNVEIFRLRSRLRRYGLTVETVRGTGFRMPPAHRRRALEIVLCQAACKPRAQYLAESKSRTKPWVQLGLSRRSWYRRLKKWHRLGTSADGLILSSPKAQIQRSTTSRSPSPQPHSQ